MTTRKYSRRRKRARSQSTPPRAPRASQSSCLSEGARAHAGLSLARSFRAPPRPRTRSDRARRRRSRARPCTQANRAQATESAYASNEHALHHIDSGLTGRGFDRFGTGADQSLSCARFQRRRRNRNRQRNALSKRNVHHGNRPARHSVGRSWIRLHPRQP